MPLLQKLFDPQSSDTGWRRVFFYGFSWFDFTSGLVDTMGKCWNVKKYYDTDSGSIAPGSAHSRF